MLLQALPVALCLGVAVALVAGGHRGRDPAQLLPAAPSTAPAAPRGDRADRARLACLLAAAAVLLGLPLPAGAVAAAVVAGAGPRLLGRLEPAAVRRDRAQLTTDLPLVLDLLGACLAGGAALPAAAAAVGAAVPGPAGRRLLAVASALAVGTPPASAWLLLAGPRPDADPLGPAARTLARSADTGAPVAAVLARLSADTRSASRAAGTEAARRAGVLAVAPLGLCFLPAFVLLGVVPVVVGLAGPVLAGR